MKTLKVFLALLIPCLVIYLLVSFFVASFDITTWTVSDRGVCATLMGIWVVCWLLIMSFNKDFDEL